MKEIEFVKDEAGRIIKVIKNGKQAVITWNTSDDIDCINNILTIVFSKRTCGGDVINE